MARHDTTPKQSSGGGYPIENEAVAWTLAHLLARSSPFDPPGGIIERVDTQRPASQWHLDDLLVTARTRRVHRLAFSIKSNRQITRKGFPEDFIRDAWEQLLHDSSDIFVEERDYLGLLTAPVDANLREAAFELLRLARGQDPEDLAVQVELPKRANAIIRKLHKSARCPDDLAIKHGVDEATSAGRLLRRLLWLPLDFEDDGSVKRAQALTLCRGLLRSGTDRHARELWERLKDIADRLRRSGGSIGLTRLVDEIRDDFDLRDFPDHEADWERVDHDTHSALKRVHTKIGGRVSLPRSADHDAVSTRLVAQRTAVLLGASGTGKSAVARAQAEVFQKRGKALWFDAERLGARTLADWRTHLGLTHALGEIIRAAPGTEGLLVFDGMDRLYDDSGFATAAEFVEAARISDPASPWRLLITCTPEEWTRVRNGLASRGVSLPESPLTLDLPSPAELKSVWAEFPQLAALRLRLHLAPVLFRPKVLDLLATHITVEDDLTLIGESDLARLFWDREITRGPHWLARGDAALRIAQFFADRLRPDVSESALATEIGSLDLAAVGELARERVLVRTDGRVAFEHDLYGDWVRVRQIRDASERGQLTEFLTSRMNSPVWHRALRLYAVDLLEQADSLSPWTGAFQEAEGMAGGAGVLAQDILLEATAFASGGGSTLYHPDLWPLFAADDGKLLSRLVKRLFHTATIANNAIVEAVTEKAPDLAIYIAATSRLPYAPYWYRILTFLHSHRKEIPAPAFGLAARAADLWLRSTLPGWPLRKEAAALAVAIGDALLKLKEEHDSLFTDGEPDQHVYRAVLAGGHEEPDRVTHIVLEASGRRAKRFARPPRPVNVAAQRKARVISIPPSWWDNGPLPDPWPHGPAFRVDGALQKAVLDGDALQPLTESLPDVAREVLLALLISEPTRRRSYNPLDEPYALEWPQWHPQFYTRGPFLSFLATAEEAAVTTILQLISHATDRWAERRALYFARERRCSPVDVPTPTLEIEVEGETHEFVGDNRVFIWSINGPDHGNIIGSALTALEKHLYDRADAGEDLSPLILRLLTEGHSVAIIGLLSVFARRHPQYLRGPLRGLLSSPYVLWWTTPQGVGMGWQIGISLLSRPHHEAYRVWHQMPHRETSLRDLALTLFLSDHELRPFFDELRERLRAGFEPGGEYEGWDFVEGLVAQLDLDNYATVEGDDGNTYIQYTPPEELRRKHEALIEPMAGHTLLITLPYEFRRLVDSQEPLDSDALDRIFSQAQQVAAMDRDAGNEVATPADVIAGAAAVITLLGRPWRAAHPDHAQWARVVILQAIEESPRGFSDGSSLKTDRSAFAADAVCQLWSESPNDPDVRKAVARLVLHGPSDHVGTVASAAARLRSQWPEDHKRLLRAILQRAALGARLREAEERTRWATDGKDEDENSPNSDASVLRKELAAVERGLQVGTLDPSVPGLDEIAPLHPIPERAALGRDRRLIPERTIHDGFLIAAFRGMPDPGSADSEWLDIWERAVRETLSPLRQPDDEPSEEPEKHSDAWDHYLLERVAGVIAGLNDLEAKARLWRPIIELGASAESWVSWFARDWARYALYPAADTHVLDTWVAMIDHALASPRWAGDGGVTYLAHKTGELWRSLLGFNHYSGDVWGEALRPRLRTLESRLAAWAKDHLLNVDNVKALAYILAKPAAADIVLQGLIWLHEAEADDRFWGWGGRREGPDDAILSLLSHVWEHVRERLRRNTSAFGAFRGLLEHLVSRQYPPALELADRVGAMLP